MTGDQGTSPGGLRGALARLPRWVRVVLGVAALALGIVVVIRPTTSLGALALLIGAGLVLQGLLGLVPSDGERLPWWRIALAVAWIAAGVFVLSWLGLTVRVVALVVGIGLIVNGVAAGVGAVRRGRSPDERIAAAAFGVAGIVFGVVALSWPDVTLLVVAVVFGAWLIMTGAVTAWRALRSARPAAAVERRPSALRRWARTIGAVVVLALAVGAASLSATLHGGSPVVDDFYAAPRDVPDEPGALIRFDPVQTGLPESARGWRILYTTTHGDGSPAVASGLVVVPREGDGSWPVIDWTHGTTGFAQNCAPSLAAQPLESGAMFLADQVVGQGWAIVATDYIGLGTAGPHPYLVGADTAHAALDAVRAARQLEEADLGEQTVVWGHSQGGAGALWTGALADDYAPELGIEGVAALAPAANLVALVHDLPDTPGGSVFGSYVEAAYTAIYSDVTARQYVRPGAEVTVRALASRCLAEPGMFVSVLDLLALSQDPDVFSSDPASGPLGERLRENIPPATISAPLLLAQGTADQVIHLAGQEEYVADLCAAGQQVDFRTYAGRDHVPLVQPDSPLVPELISWTEDRLAGVPVEPGCTRADE